MKSILFLVAALTAAPAAFADSLKAYDCKTAVTGSVTVDKITLRANQDSLVMNFPDYSVDDKYTASFDRTAETNVPVALSGHSGGEYFAVANGDSLINGKEADYQPMYAFATNGILRANASGTMIVFYKRTLSGQPSTNSHEWSRQYHCVAR